MFTFTRALGIVATLALLSPVFLSAQTPVNPLVNLGSVAVGASSAATPVTITAPATANFTLSYGSDFALGAPSCSGSTCSVPVTFTPTHPGVRRGAISAFDGASLLSVTPLLGAGAGPQISIGPGLITTIASRTNAQLATSTLFGAAARSSSQIYVSDSANHEVLLVVPATGQVSIVAGTGTAGFSGDGGLATAAQLAAPSGLAIDSAGNLLIADTGNNRIRKLDLTSGVINTVAGNGSQNFSGDGGLATSASLNSPGAVAIRLNGDILIADAVNDRVRQVAIASGVISTMAGNGVPGFSGDNGTATSAQLNGPTGLAVDGNDRVYIADVQNDVIREVSNGTITTVAGQGGSPGFSGDNGPATSALLKTPYGVAVDAAGDLYIGDAQNNRVRKVTGDASHLITTIAGTSTSGYLGDGGSATSAQLSGPSYMSTDDVGNVYFLDSGNVAVRRVSAAPAPVSFPLTSVGSPSNSTVTVSNIGTQTLSVSAFTFSANFTLGSGGTCSANPTLVSGQSCTAVLAFTPTTGGVTSGTISLASNSLNVPSASQPVIVSQSNGLYFVAVPPCRVVDTRFDVGFSGTTFAANEIRNYALRNSPNCAGTIPSSADVRAYSLNVTVVPVNPFLDFLTVGPGISARPSFSTLNSYDGRTKANAAIVPANLADNNRSVSVFATDPTSVIIDINGYFVPQGTPNALAYYPLPPCRITDTRQAGNPGGAILGTGETRNFALVNTCNVPATAQAYSLNFTAIPQGFNGAPGSGAPVPFITVWPAGTGAQPVVSTLNATTGTVTANAAIVPAGTSGNISVFAQAATNLIVDVSGYYAPPASAPGGLAFYGSSVCRAFDSRFVNSPSEQGASVNGVLDVDIHTPCAVPAVAQDFVLNATVVPVTTLGYLTIWARGSSQPLQSTLNAYDGAITSNLAIVPTSDGSIASFTFAPTGLIFDLFGYFAP